MRSMIVKLSVLLVLVSSVSAYAGLGTGIISDCTDRDTNRDDPVVVTGGLVNGALCFIDREYTYDDVGILSGIDYVQTEMDGRKNDGEATWYDVTLNKAGTLMLLIENIGNTNNNVDGTFDFPLIIGDPELTEPIPEGFGAMAWVIEDGFTRMNDITLIGGEGLGYTIMESTFKPELIRSKNRMLVPKRISIRLLHVLGDLVQ